MTGLNKLLYQKLNYPQYTKATPFRRWNGKPVRYPLGLGKGRLKIFFQTASLYPQTIKTVF